MITMLRFTPFLAVLAALAPAACAADGRIPISSLPVTLNAPGSYYLTRNLSNASGAAVIISASGVTLDLAGHQITQTVATSVIDFTANPTRVEIENGILLGGTIGVNYIPSGAGEFIIRVHRLKIVQFTAWGIDINPQSGATVSAQITDNEVTATPGACQVGIYLTAGIGSRIERNRVRGCTQTANPTFSPGILAITVGGVIADNQASNNGGEGLRLIGVTGCQISRNVATGNNVGLYLTALSGIYTGKGNQVTDNTLSGNVSGLSIAVSGNLYARNSADGAPPINVVAGNASGGGNCNLVTAACS